MAAPYATPEQHARPLLVILVVVAVALALLLVKPIWQALFLAAVLAAALRPLMEWLSRKLRGRRNAAAAIMTVSVVLAGVIPVAGLTAVLVGQVADGVRWLREAMASEGVWGLIQRLPAPAQDAARRILDALPDPQHGFQELAGRSSQAAAAVGGVLAATGTALFQTAMMLIALFFFLTDGRGLVEWIDRRVPMRPGQFRTLMDDFRKTSVSVLVSTLGTAAIQTVVAVVGYVIARAPNVTFLALVTFVLALIPAVGAAAVVIAVGLLLLATGKTLAGVFLVVWGAAVVSIADNVARPFLLKGGMELHGGVVFFALIGGLATFGGIGLLVGPLVLTFLVAALNLYRREFRASPEDLTRSA
jgi:predicted PurR-regulated permease PerM